MFKAKLLALLLLNLFFVNGQEQNNNITIKEAKEVYEFKKGNKDNPVKIKVEEKKNYYCNDYRTSIVITEFYNNQIEINDISIRVDGDRRNGIQKYDDYYSVDGVFFSDTRVNYFTLPLEKKGSASSVSYEKTYLDPRYFTTIYFSDNYAVEKKEVQIVVPIWMKVEIKELNFLGLDIQVNKTTNSSEDVYTYTIKNIPAEVQESQSQGASYTQPHLLIMCKYAEPDGSRITYFNTLQDQYNWYRSLVKEIGNDITLVKAKADELTKGITDNIQKVKTLYQWVQDNIRYIAYEDGIAGFKPDKAQDVLRKKYGDCKGMGNLMAEMLKAINLDGRICWLGTNHIAYDYSTPSLSVDNHVICAWLYNGKTYFLDATEKFIGLGENAERIQGRQVLIENGENYILERIPVSTPQQNTAIEKRVLKVVGNNLEGKVYQTWKGESKEWLLSRFNDIKKDNQTEALTNFLTGGQTNVSIKNLKIINLENYNQDAQVEYDILIKDGVTSFDKEMYIEMDFRKEFSEFKFNLEKRKKGYQFYYKTQTIYETELQLPENFKLQNSIPEFKISEPNYQFSGIYKQIENKVLYKREININNTLLHAREMEKWNKNITLLASFYNTQLTLTK